MSLACSLGTICIVVSLCSKLNHSKYRILRAGEFQKFEKLSKPGSNVTKRRKMQTTEGNARLNYVNLKYAIKSKGVKKNSSANSKA